jgi:hypothetical protein
MKHLRLLLSTMLLIVGASGQAAPIELLTPKQARQPGRTKTPAISAKAPDPGAPVIVFDKPSPGASVAAPFPVKVRFITSGGAKIAMDTVKVDVLKVVPISILSKVKPYLTTPGINLPEASIPSGKYDVRILVSDAKGRQGEAEGTWVVK